MWSRFFEINWLSDKGLRASWIKQKDLLNALRKSKKNNENNFLNKLKSNLIFISDIKLIQITVN